MSEAKTVRSGVLSEFPSQEIMLQMEGLNIGQWAALQKFGKTPADKAARSARVQSLEGKIRRLAVVLRVGEDDALKQFLELKDRSLI